MGLDIPAPQQEEGGEGPAPQGGGDAAPASVAEGGGGKAQHPPPIHTHPPQVKGRKEWGTGAVRHACTLTINPSPAAPWSGGRAQLPSKGWSARRRGGRRRRERRPAMGEWQGGRLHTQGGAPFPVSSKAEGLPEHLVHAVRARPLSNAAEGIGPPCRGMNLSRLHRDGPPHIGDHREEVVDGVGHVPPRLLGPRVRGWLAGGIVVPNPAQPVHAHGVVPAGGRLPLEEGGAGVWAEEPAGRGVVPPLHAASPDLPPQELARLLPPHGGQVPMPPVPKAAAAGVRPGGARVEDLGVPPLEGLTQGGPLGLEIGAARAVDGGDSDLLVLRPVTAGPPTIPGSRQKVLEPQDHG